MLATHLYPYPYIWFGILVCIIFIRLVLYILHLEMNKYEVERTQAHIRRFPNTKFSTYMITYYLENIDNIGKFIAWITSTNAHIKTYFSVLISFWNPCFHEQILSVSLWHKFAICVYMIHMFIAYNIYNACVNIGIRNVQN